MSKPDMTPISRFPDLEKPGRERLNQLFRLFILTTRGDILTRGATYLKRLALGAAGTVLHSDGTDVEWAVLKASEVEVEELDSATYDDVQNFINFFGDRTVLSGLGITAHGDADGKVVIAAGTAWCKVTDSTTAIGKFFDYAGKVSQTLTDLSANFIYLDYNGGTPQVVVATALLTYGLKLDHILLGVVFRNGTATHIHNTEHIGISGVGRSNLHWLEHFLVHRVAGAVTSEAGTRQLAVTAGVVYAGLSRNATNVFNTSTGDTFSYWYYDGDAGPAVWVEVTGQTVISNTQYNDTDTGLVNLSAAAKRGVHWVYLDNDGVHLHVVYGQGDYSTAEAELAAVPASLPPLVTNYCVLIAKIIVQKDQDTMYISYPWTSAFQTSLAADHGSLAGLDDDDHTKYLLADGTRELVGILATAESELTIDTDGEITVTQTRHKVDTFEDAASDDLSTINGGTTVNLIILRAEADARTVVLKHGTGNIWLQGKADVSLDDLEDGILLVWDSTNSKWFDISSGGGVADHDLLNNLNWAAAGHTIDADIDFNEFKAIEMVCDNGTTAPAAPTKGQWFLHTPTGRNVLMMYNGSNWIPIISAGTMTMYVDKTDGSDAIDKGTGVDGDAFATVQYAVDAIPATYGGNVTININGETYSEDIVIRGKNAGGNYEIILEGSMSTEAAKAGIDSETATTITDTGAFIGLTLAGMLIEFTKAGETTYYNIVKSHTNDIITIAGQHHNDIDSTWDYEVLSWDTVLQGDATEDYGIQGFCNNVRIFKIDFTNDSTTNFFGILFNGASGIVQASTYEASASNNRRGIDALNGAIVTVKGCYINQSNNSSTNRQGGLASRGSAIECEDNWWHGGSGTGDGIVIQGSAGWVVSRSLYSHWDIGVDLTSSSGSRLNTGATALAYIENCTTGIYASTNGSVVNGLSQNFNANTADTATATGGQIT